MMKQRRSIPLRFAILVLGVASLWDKCSPVLCWTVSTLISSLLTTDSSHGTYFSALSNELLEFSWRKWDRHAVKKLKDMRSMDVLVYSSGRNKKYDLSQPLLFKGIIDVNDPSRMLSVEGMMKSPLCDLLVPYFSDSSKQLLTPDFEAPLGDIVQRIKSKQSNEKIGSQIPVHTFPDLILELSHPIFIELFGNRFKPSDLNPFLGILPALTTVPIFLASYNERYTAKRSRTDLHSEPIGNVSIQLNGRKKWTLIDPSYSIYLRPRVAEDGRAYYFSSLDPFDTHAFKRVPKYEVITEPGDALWVPPWFWHRVDYDEPGVSLAASLFHFRPWEFVKNNTLYSILIVPNLVKELFGFKMQ